MSSCTAWRCSSIAQELWLAFLGCHGGRRTPIACTRHFGWFAVPLLSWGGVEAIGVGVVGRSPSLSCIESSVALGCELC